MVLVTTTPGSALTKALVTATRDAVSATTWATLPGTALKPEALLSRKRPSKAYVATTQLDEKMHNLSANCVL